MNKITKDTTIREVIENYPEVLEVLAENLQGQCLGCAMAQFETLEQAAEHHGIEIDKLLSDLNSIEANKKE